MLLAALCGFGAPEAHACGELMLRSLGAMRFHPFATRNPATIMLYSGPVASQWSASVNASLHAALEKVGHNVRQARGPGELGQMLVASRFDVLIAHADDMLSASGEIARAAREPALIPVLDASATNEREMRERYPRLVTGGFSSLLRAIEQAMAPAKA
jgi:hypothetical protein